MRDMSFNVFALRKKVSIRILLKSLIWALALLGVLFILIMGIVLGYLRTPSLIAEVPEKAVLMINLDNGFDEARQDDLLNEVVQNWFFDEVTSSEFNTFIEKLSAEFKNNNFSVDLDKFVADNFDSVFTAKELTYQLINFNVAAYLRCLKGDKELARTLYSLGSNYAFLTNILRKSIYEYYVGRRYLLKNQRKSANMFEQKMQPKFDDFKLLQLDMIISSIEAKWVDNA